MSVPLSLGQVGVLEAALSQHSRSFVSVYNKYNTINFTKGTVFRSTRPLNKYICSRFPVFITVSMGADSHNP